jgi:hypothetical protein
MIPRTTKGITYAGAANADPHAKAAAKTRFKIIMQR